MVNRLCCGKLEGPTKQKGGPTKQNLPVEKISISRAILLGFLRSLVSHTM